MHVIIYIIIICVCNIYVYMSQSRKKSNHFNFTLYNYSSSCFAVPAPMLTCFICKRARPQWFSEERRVCLLGKLREDLSGTPVLFLVTKPQTSHSDNTRPHQCDLTINNPNTTNTYTEEQTMEATQPKGWKM